MRVAVVFDTPYSGWDHPEHERQMELEVAAWKANEPENGIPEWAPDLVFNGAEAFSGEESRPKATATPARRR